MKRTGEVTLVEGENLLSIVGLETGIVPTTIQMSIADEVGVFSLAYSTDPNGSVQEPDSLKELRKQRIAIEFERRMLVADNEALQEELAVFNANRSFSAENTSAPEEIQRGAKLFSESIRSTKRAIVELGFALERLNEKGLQLDRRIATIRPAIRLDIGKIDATTIAKKGGTFTYEISYLVQHAGWTPDYDLFSKTKDEQFAELVLVGNIYQQTGVDWKDVELTLSTGNPRQRMMAPSLKRLYLGEKNVYNQPAVQGMLLSREQVKLLGTKSINAIASLSAGASANDVGDAIKMRGGRSNATKYIIDGLRVTGTLVPESEIDQIQSTQIKFSSIGEPGRGYVPVPQISFAKESSTLTSRTYKVDRAFSLAASGTSSAVRLTSHILPLDLRYRSVPKIDPTVYLEGIVTGWDTLRLSDGRMRLHLDGRYLGTTVLIANQPSDTLLLPLGADERIIIERESAKQLVDRKPVRGRKNYQLGYTISVRNTRKESINLLIEDQVPVSKKEEAEVDLISAGLSPKHDASTGIFTWDLTLAPASAKRIDVAYEVTAGKFVKVNFE